jgi:hypothetical protein
MRPVPGLEALSFLVSPEGGHSDSALPMASAL